MRVMGIDPGLHTGVVWVDDSHLDIIKKYGFEEHCDDSPLSGIEGSGCKICGYDELVGATAEDERWMCARIAGMITNMEADLDCIFIEDFILGHGKTKMHTAERSGLSAVRVIAMLSVWIHDVVEFKGYVGMQQPSQAKGVITDARLRSSGFWVVGSAHVRDAGRHALLGLRRARNGELA